MEPLLVIPIFLSFFCTFLIIPSWIRNAKRNNLTGKDIHKKHQPEIAEGGGVSILFGVLIGILLYVAIRTFYFHSTEHAAAILTILCVILISAIVGMFDDVLGWKKGLSRKVRLCLIFFAAVPLMVINAGEATMMGVNFGLIYPLLLIPLGVVGATTTFNFLAGYNGLEASQGILILSALAIVNFLLNQGWLSIICLCMVASLIAFYIYNKNPSKVFPGDITTYSIGALIAGIAIIGNIEKIAIFFYIPYIIEVGLKVRGKLKKESFAKVNEKGYLEVPYSKIYSLTHLSIFILKKFKKNVREKEVVYLINGFQLLVILLGFLFFL